MFVELEFSTLENLLVRKLKSKIKEDSFLYLYTRVPIFLVGTFFMDFILVNGFENNSFYNPFNTEYTFLNLLKAFA